ncbi:hypothetical protein CC79DRAFT_1373449 [Sarocladium strictum]
MRISIPAFLLATPLLAEAACRFEFWQYDNFPFGDGSGRANHAWMVRTDLFGDNMDFPRMIDDFCSIFHRIRNDGDNARPRECIRDSNTSGHARTDTLDPGELHRMYEDIIWELQFAGYGVCQFVNHAAY